MTGILVFFHCGSNAGYAIQRHEFTFSQMAYNLTADWNNVHFGYPSLENGRSLTIPDQLTNIVKIDPLSNDKNHIDYIKEYINRNNIQIAFGFDQPVNSAFYSYLRSAGVKYIYSYLGAPMSSLNSGIKLLLKKIEVRMYRNRPDAFIFQSHGMKLTATQGRGIPERQCHVINSGIDTEKFKPDLTQTWYAHDTFNIPRERKIVYYSGHMAHRKGVHVIVKSAAHLINTLNRTDLHFIFFGNKQGQESAFHPLYKGTKAESHITFGGYRHDLFKIIPCCQVGCLATTGWDSFPMSTLEITSSGVPLIVSDLLGVRETVIPNETGFRFTAGDFVMLAERIMQICDDDELRVKLGQGARKRVESFFKREMQIENLTQLIAKESGSIFMGLETNIRSGANVCAP